MTFSYFMLPPPLAWLRRCQAGLNLYYYAWQLAARQIVRRLQARLHFDIIQHLTYARYWMPSAGAAARPGSGIFVWGPVGGGEDMPAAFRAGLGGRGWVLDHARRTTRALFEMDPLLRRTARRADLALATTDETAARLRALGARRVEVCSAIGMSDFPAIATSARPLAPRPFRVFSAGRLLHWKGFHLGLQAFAQAGLAQAEYHLFGEGPDRGRLQRLAQQLGLGDRVVFRGAMSRDEFLAAVAECDVLIHPSLHDSGGAVCLEAMAMEKPVICLALGGPGAIVTEQTGMRIDARDPAQAVTEMAAAIQALARDLRTRARLGSAARQHCAACYDWDRRAAYFAELYAEIHAAHDAAGRTTAGDAQLPIGLKLTDANP